MRKSTSSVQWFCRPSGEVDLFVRMALYSVIAVLSGLALYGATAEESFAQTLDSAPAPAQNSYYRAISDSVSVASAFGSPSAPNHYARTMSESLSVTSTFPGQAQQAGPAASPALRTTQYSPGINQRGDERANLAFKNLKKSDLIERSAADATPYLNLEALAALPSGSDNATGDMEGSGDASEPDDNSAFLRQLALYNAYVSMQKSEQNAALVNASISLVLLLGTVGVVIVRQPAFSSSRTQRKIVALFVLKHARPDYAPYPVTRNAPTKYALVLVFTLSAFSFTAFSATPTSAEEYVEDLKSRIDLSAAYHLDSDKQLVDDISRESGELDGVWTEEIPDGDYIRVVFEQSITSARDISIYPRVVSGSPVIEVYEKDGTQPVAEFAYVGSNEYNKVFLKGLQGSQNTFDLRVVGGSVEFDHIVDPFPIPTYVGAGTTFNSGATGTVALPASLQANDILLLVVETANQAVSVTAGGSAGTWTAVTNSPQGANGGSLATSTRLTVFWARYPGTGTTGPTISDSGNHQIAAIHAFRGVITSGNPWDITSGNVETTSDTSLSATGATTTVANTLVVILATLMDDAQNFGATWTNANLANITTRNNFSGTAGNDGRGIVVTGEKATAGSYGATTNTLTANSVKAMMTIALRPPPPEPPTLSISQPDGTGDTVTGEDTYNITYTLTDSDSVTTAAFFYDTNNSGLDGTAISGACATAPEGTDVTCAWDISGVSPGTYYVYGIANDGENPAVSAYSPGQITVNPISRSAADSLTITPAISMSVTRSIPDSLSTTDSISAQKSFPRSIPDSISITDAITPRVSRFVSDSISITDAITKRVSRSISDNVAISDAISMSVTRSVSDTLTLADTAAAKVTGRAVADSTSISDAITVNVSRSAQDSLTFSDSISMSVSRSLSDSLSISDAITPIFTRSIADSVTITDDISTIVTPLLSDSLTIADDISTHVTRSISDSLSITDTAAKSTSSPVADSLALSDSISTAVTRDLSNSLALSDSISMSVTRSIGDTLSITDTVVRVPTRAIADSVALDDAISTFVSRSISDSVTVADAIAMSVSRSTSDSVTLSDSISTAVTRSIADALSLEDSISASPTITISDNLSVTDAISRSVTRSVQNTISLTDAISTSVTRSISDDLTIADAAAKSSSRSISDSMTFSDSISASVTRSIADSLTLDDSISRSISVTYTIPDSLTLTDNISKSVTRSIADSLTISEVASASTGRTMDDSLTLTDNISKSVTRSPSDSMTASDAITVAITRSISDALSISDVAAVVNAYTAPVSDSVSVADSATGARAATASAADSLAVSDAISIRVAYMLSDTISITDATKPPFMRSISDSLAISDNASAISGVAVAISDSLAISSQLTEVSVHWNRTFDESFTLGDCTPFSCNQVLTFDESLALADGFAALRVELQDAVSITDAITTGYSYVKQVSDTLATNDIPATFMKAAPPAVPPTWSLTEMPRLEVASNSTLVQPPLAPSLPSTYDASGGLAGILSQTGMPQYDTTSILASTDMTGKTLVIPMFRVGMNPSPDLPAQNGLISPIVSSIPANTAVAVPVDINATTLAALGVQHPIPWIDLQFTPNVDSTNFTMMASMLTSEPAGADKVPEDKARFYLDIRFDGTFSGTERPSDSGFYAAGGKPTFSFGLSDAWATEQGMTRDANGVPILSMSLLNEATGQWEDVTNIDPPTSAVNGVYNYVARLEHFSTYVVTANTAATPPPAVGGRGFASLNVLLTDSLQTIDSPKGVAVEVIEEFGGKKFNVALADLLAVSTRPIAYQTFQVGENVQVSIGLDDITSEGILPQTAKARFLVQVENSGPRYETFKLNFWYYDQSGKNAYDSSQEVEIGPFESRERAVEVPFSSPGTFAVVAEARSVPEDNLINATQFTVDIPWLSIYFYTLLIVAVAIIGSSAAAVAILLMKRNVKAPAILAVPLRRLAGAASALSVVRKTGVAEAISSKISSAAKSFRGIRGMQAAREAPAGAATGGLLVSVNWANSIHGSLPIGEYTAVIDFDAVNRSRGQIFLMRYWAVDMAGEVIYSASETLTIEQDRPKSWRMKVELPSSGDYIFHMEAKSARDGKVEGSAQIAIKVL